jgi:putative membrane protein
MKKLMALLLVGIPVLAFGADKQNPDHDFFTQAAEAGLAEVDLGKLAEKKAADPAVKQFAAEMVKDHSSANDKLKNLAEQKGVTLPSDLTTAQKASRKTLEMQSAADFDQAYIKNQVDAHEDTIALLKKEIASGKDNEAKALAQSMLPIVQGHLQQVQQLEKATAGNDRTPNKMIDRTAETGSVHHADQ